MGFSVTDVTKALKGADFPATGGELADLAASNGAEDDLVDAIGDLEDTFESPTEVVAAMRDELGEDDDDE